MEEKVELNEEFKSEKLQVNFDDTEVKKKISNHWSNYFIIIGGWCYSLFSLPFKR